LAVDRLLSALLLRVVERIRSERTGSIAGVRFAGIGLAVIGQSLPGAM